MILDDVKRILNKKQATLKDLATIRRFVEGVEDYGKELAETLQKDICDTCYRRVWGHCDATEERINTCSQQDLTNDFLALISETENAS